MPVTVPPALSKTRVRRVQTRSGYVAAAIVNAILIWVSHNLLAWEWPPFLTDDFSKLLPLLTVSLAATVLINLVYLVFDPGWFTSLCRIGLNGISLAVAIRTWQVFPFDFSAYDFDWAAVARVVLIVAMVGIAIAIIVEMVKLANGSAETTT